MASATGIPQHAPIDPDVDGQTGDLEPLLGRPGDASQREQAPIIKNLVLGVYPQSLFFLPYIRFFNPKTAWSAR
jgi:hypothetical protein